MKEIQLTQGQITFVDDNDFPLLSQFNWYADKRENTSYAARIFKDADGIKRKVYMHRLILGEIDKYLHIDHIDGNGLNNVRENLRIVTRSQNQMNSIAHKKRGSKYKGVSFFKPAKKWRARIMINRVEKHIGYFDSQELAAAAVNEAYKIHFGEFARANII